ncbi:MAG: nucleotidyltransferase family protein [Solimicrobium sp.]|nr:nucleotidyltransferase family protein [Solimicrobium sp.]
MMPLTEHCPKPLLKVRGRPLIVWQILNLVKAGITDIVINHAYLGEMIEATLGDGSQFGARLAYSREAKALETAGGIAHALRLLGDEPFLAVSADIYCPHFDFSQCINVLEDHDVWGNPHPDDKRDMAWLYLVKNPLHHLAGDFALNLYNLSVSPKNPEDPKFTFANIGVYRPEMFKKIPLGTSAKLVSLFHHYANLGQLGGELIKCAWTNVGTPEQLNELNSSMAIK